MRPRVCGAILKGKAILMVRHRENDREYWTLPGGGVEAGETPEQAVVREMREETGLDAEVVRFLFAEDYRHGTCQCFLMTASGDQQTRLGHDPEEAHLSSEERLLRGVAWQPLELMATDAQVTQVLAALNDGGTSRRDSVR